MPETLDTLGVKIDAIMAGQNKLNKLVLGNGDPGLCETVRNVQSDVADLRGQISIINLRAKADKIDMKFDGKTGIETSLDNAEKDLTAFDNFLKAARPHIVSIALTIALTITGVFGIIQYVKKMPPPLPLDRRPALNLLNTR